MALFASPKIAPWRKVIHWVSVIGLSWTRHLNFEMKCGHSRGLPEKHGSSKRGSDFKNAGDSSFSDFSCSWTFLSGEVLRLRIQDSVRDSPDFSRRFCSLPDGRGVSWTVDVRIVGEEPAVGGRQGGSGNSWSFAMFRGASRGSNGPWSLTSLKSRRRLLRLTGSFARSWLLGESSLFRLQVHEFFVVPCAAICLE